MENCTLFAWLNQFPGSAHIVNRKLDVFFTLLANGNSEIIKELIFEICLCSTSAHFNVHGNVQR